MAVTLSPHAEHLLSYASQQPGADIKWVYQSPGPVLQIGSTVELLSVGADPKKIRDTWEGVDQLYREGLIELLGNDTHEFLGAQFYRLTARGAAMVEPPGTGATGQG